MSFHQEGFQSVHDLSCWEIQYSKYSTKDHFFPFASLCWNPHMRQSRRSTGLRRCCSMFWLRKVVIFMGFSRSHSEIKTVTYSPGKHQQLQVLDAALPWEHWLPRGRTGGQKCWSSPESYFHTRFPSLLGSDRTLRPDLAVDGGAAPAPDKSQSWILPLPFAPGPEVWSTGF